MTSTKHNITKVIPVLGTLADGNRGPMAENESINRGGEEVKNLHTRLDDQKEEILKVSEMFGPFRGMQKAGVATYTAFRRWLTDVTGDENFGIPPKISLDGRQSLGDQLVDAFLRKVANLEAQLAEKNERVKYLEWQQSLKGEKEGDQSIAVLDVCRL